MQIRTTYATGDPARMAQAVEVLIREAVPALTPQPGYRGFGLFADRQLGKIAMASWWENRQAERASNGRLQERRTELLAPFAASVTIDSMEAAVFTPPQNPPGPGAGWRLARLEFDPGNVEQLVDTFQELVLPKCRAIAGFVGATLLLERATGHAAAATMWQDRAALVASRGPQAAVRSVEVPKSGVLVRSLEEFDVVLLDHRVEPR
jgi:quinol monooxygenase YgiN